MGVFTRARRLFSRERKLTENVVGHSKLDEAVLHDWRKRAPMLDEEIGSPPQVSRSWTDDDGHAHDRSGPLNPRVWERMVEDTFYAYFGKDEPEVATRDEIAPEFRVNRAVADKLVRGDEFTHQRSKTRGRGMEATLGASAALDSIRRSYEGELREDAQRESEIANRQDTIEKLDEMMAELRERRDEDPEQADEKLRELAQAKRRVVDDLKHAEAEMAGRVVEIAQNAREAAQRARAAAGQAIETAATMIGFGPGAEPGKELRIAPDTMFALANRYAQSDVLRRVAEMMGRLELTMGSERRTMRKGGSEEMVDIELGRDLTAVLAHEKVLMRHPMGRLDFFRRYTEQSLTQYEMWSEQELKRGPVIVLADGSASMRGAKNIWCRATTLAIVGLANRENRNAAAIEFGSRGQAVTFTWPKGLPMDPVTSADFAEHMFNGGTSTLTGMREAADLIRHEAPFHTADLVIATDGEDTITDEDIAIRDELRAMGVRIHGMSIGIAPTRYLLAMCERTTAVHEYAGHNEANHRLAVDLT